ncbi:hypothetical protein OSB04_024514 [Centaurea solstitialis]|uniref:GAG-pre-integrase domain-containing protein n=1 Tax=Centaurea solstitialis TaxID=347529 RepID=A0AA38W0Q1_9ASTR|nr:hypothetical protein OSB04_024514 [Centaurea solstitialis]
MNLDSVLVVPSLSSNLLSVSQITKALNCYVIFWPNYCVFQDIATHKTLGCGTRKGRLYYLEDDSSSQAFHTRIKEANKSMGMLWHRRLGHLSFGYLKKLKPKLFLNLVESEFKCGICELTKNTRISYVSSDNKVSVPIPTPSDARYFVTFIDECTRMVWVAFDVLIAFKELYHHIKTEYRVDIQILQSDNGGEYINHEMARFCQENSIRQQTSCVRTVSNYVQKLTNHQLEGNLSDRLRVDQARAIRLGLKIHSDPCVRSIRGIPIKPNTNSPAKWPGGKKE